MKQGNHPDADGQFENCPYANFNDGHVTSAGAVAEIRTPAGILLSAVIIVVVIFLGGCLIAATPFHRQMAFYADHHELPPPLAFVYGTPFRAPPPPDVYHGVILATTTDGFVIVDKNGAGTTTVIVDGRTRLPDGVDFSVGTPVVVVGDRLGSSTVQAFGVRESDE